MDFINFFSITKEEKKQIIDKHKKLFFEEQIQNKPESISFDLSIGDKNYGKAVVFLGKSQSQTERDKFFNRYVLSVNKKPILSYGDKGLIVGPSTASQLMKALNVGPLDYNDIANLIELNFKKLGATITIPKLKNEIDYK